MSDNLTDRVTDILNRMTGEDTYVTATAILAELELDALICDLEKLAVKYRENGLPDHERGVRHAAREVASHFDWKAND